METTKKNQSQSKNGDLENAYIDIATYEDVFSIITLLTKKYIVPNVDTLPKEYRFDPSNFQIEIGKKYRKRDNFEVALYFVPEGFIGYSFISEDLMGPSTYELKEIFYDLYPPQQILYDFYKTLMTFTKNNKQQIKGLKLPLQFMKIILENEEEYRT